MAASSPRVTELPNPLTVDIDVASPEGMVRLLGASDAQLFSGYGGLPGLCDEEVVAATARAAALAAAALRHPRGRVFMAGCGTSGRLSHMESLSLNTLAAAAGLRGDAFGYLLAGGDAALRVAQEAAEDPADAGRAAAAAALAAPGRRAGDPLLIIGISCGLSATYVGALLAAALAAGGEGTAEGEAVACVALGFNPVAAMAGLRVEGWASSFHAVLTDMLTGPGAGRSVVLNPVLGPEAIAGSSRLKGGSGTKMLLEGLVGAACEVAAGRLPPAGPALHAHIRECFLAYETTVRRVYHCVPAIAGLLAAAAASVTTPVDPAPPAAAAAAAAAAGRSFMSPTGRGRLVYLGVGAAGLLGLIDASECPPTYGALFNDVRGFLGGGWADLRNAEGPAPAGALAIARHMRGDAGLPSAPYPEAIKLGVREGFLDDVVPTLVAGADTVVLLAIHGDGTGFGSGGGEESGPSPGLAAALSGVAAAAARGCAVRHVVVTQSGAGAGAAAFLAAVTVAAPLGVALVLPCTTLPSPAPAPSPAPLPPPRGPQVLAELALKLVLNATTTGAHIAKGTIVRNRMVAVMLTNVKLFHRAVGIAADVAACPRGLAEACMLRAIYGVEGSEADVAARFAATPVLAHVAAASTQLHLVPVAVLLALDTLARAGGEGCEGAGAGARPALTVAGAQEALKAEPVLRKAIAAALGKRA
jgi:N-acetylmuramic acid 6-phosphate (MurNAc-6-P) etherase